MTLENKADAIIGRLQEVVKELEALVREHKSDLIYEFDQRGGLRFGFPLLSDVAGFLRDPTPYHCDAHGVNREQYLAWVASGRENGFNTIRCAALTTKGERCKNLVGGASSVLDWVDRQDTVCVVHGGDDAT